MTVILKGSSPYLAKDQLKANLATKFIGQGSSKSSTNNYRICFGDKANCGTYTDQDVVFVSVEGNRKDRLKLNSVELLLALKAKAKIITDTPFNRHRSYNIGEREAEALLLANGYKEIINTGHWIPI